MSTEAQLKAISNSELASGNQIPALKHRTVNNAIIEEMYDAQSRGDILAGVQTAVSIASGDQVLVIRSGQAYLLDSTEFGFVDALADLTDVSIPAPANDQVLAYNTATSKWEAKDVNNLTSVVSISGNATTNTLTKFTGTSSIGDSIISDNGSTVNIAGDLSVNNDLRVGTINSGTSSDFVKGDGSLDSTTYQDTNEKSQANGYAALDSGAKIPLANLPDSILGQVRYQGTWAASTNTPTLANPPASTTKGEYYVASDNGTQFGIDFQVGDWIISNGTAWEKVDNTDAVTSVFGRLGNVVANAGDYDAFYVNLDGTQTITGEKTFDNDLTVNGSLDVTSDLAVDTDTLFVDSTNNSVLIGTSVDNGTGESLQVTGDVLIKKSGDEPVINIQSDAADALEFIGSINFFADNGSDFLGVLGYQSVGGSDMKLQNSRGSLVLVSVADDVVLFPGSGGSVRVINGDFKVNTDTLFVDVSTNQVGIGTDNPSAKLDVVGDAEINGTLNVLGLSTITSSSSVPLILESSSAQVNLRFTDANSTRDFRYIGSTNTFSTTTASLEVGGNAEINGDLTVDTDTLFVDASANRVGINNSSMAATLEVNRTDGDGGVFIARRNSGTNRPALVVTVTESDTLTTLRAGSNNSLGSLAFSTGAGGSEAMRIDSSGRVGIGTTPDVTLDLDDGLLTDIRIRGNRTINERIGGISFYNTPASDTIAAINVDRDGADDAGAITFDTQPAGGGNTERMRIESDGGIFFNSLGGFSVSNSDVRYNTTSKELYYQTSSKRYKSEITDLESSLSKVNNLRPVRFKDNSSKQYATGMIAEEVAKIIPEVVFVKPIDGFDEPQIEGINYSDLTPFLIKAMQEQQEIINDMKAEIETLKQQINGQ